MSPVVAKLIRDWLEAEYAEAQGPFTAEKVRAPEFTITYTPKCGSQEPTSEEVSSVREGIDDFSRGDYADASIVSQRVRDRYGL